MVIISTCLFCFSFVLVGHAGELAGEHIIRVAVKVGIEDSFCLRRLPITGPATILSFPAVFFPPPSLQSCHALGYLPPPSDQITVE